MVVEGIDLRVTSGRSIGSEAHPNGAKDPVSTAESFMRSLPGMGIANLPYKIYRTHV